MCDVCARACSMQLVGTMTMHIMDMKPERTSLCGASLCRCCYKQMLRVHRCELAGCQSYNSAAALRFLLTMPSSLASQQSFVYTPQAAVIGVIVLTNIPQRYGAVRALGGAWPAAAIHKPSGASEHVGLVHLALVIHTRDLTSFCLAQTCLWTTPNAAVTGICSCRRFPSCKATKSRRRYAAGCAANSA